MEMLSKIEVQSTAGSRTVELYCGDLGNLPVAHRVDILMLSAFPDNYEQTDNSLIGALAKKGVSIAELARNKAMDLRTRRSCWLSSAIDQALGFRRILCFEPRRGGTPQEGADDIFDSLEQILLGGYRDSSVAMPLVTTGDMVQPVEEMLTALLNAAVARLQIGLPLSCLKIVELDPVKASALQQLFQAFILARGERILAKPRRQRAIESAPSPPPATAPQWESRARHWLLGKMSAIFRRAAGTGGAGTDGVSPVIVGGAAAGGSLPNAWDLFVSYAHEDVELVDKFLDMVRVQHPRLRIFRDSDSLRKGGDWISELAEAIDSSRCFVALFSPDYFDSKWCRREFNAAIIRQDQGDHVLLYPIFLRDDKCAPSLYLTFNHTDCREADLAKLRLASKRLLERFG